MPLPTSQKAGDAPIAFALLLNNQIVNGAFFDLPIRPTELERSEPSRSNVQQTLGKPFLDNFDRGLITISINGNTGWRGSLTQDGAQIYHSIRDDIFVQWHTLRKAQQQAGNDPNKAVQMVFVDTLNGFIEVVAPLGPGMKLRRSRSQSLLYQYSMHMVVLRDASDPGTLVDKAVLSADNPTLPAIPISRSAAAALAATIAERSTLLGQINQQLGPAYSMIGGMVAGSLSVLQTVQAATAAGIDAFDGVTAPLIFAASSIESAARNITQSLVTPLALTEQIKGTMRALYSNFSEAFCNLQNSFQAPGQYLDFSALNGASNCSSTTGGGPQSIYATQNPFEALYTGQPALVQIDSATQNAINQGNQDALVLNAQSTGYKLSLAAALAAGLPQQ